MNARTDSFEGLHVLLVTEDDARAQAIAKSLRERRAHVGDVRAGARDPVAMRGADLLVIDARRAASIDARVAEVRADVRARWASVATIDYTTLAAGDGVVDLRALEGIVSRLAGMDKALTERARKEASFETTLAPLGPTRTLRALALAGPTLHVELTDGELTASVDLADELLVAASAERRGERWEAWHALAHVLGMTDANVVVKHRSHPTAMNIMEPVDQALEGAAQERVRAPELFQEPVEELSGLRGDRRENFADIAESLAQSVAPGAIQNGASQRSRSVLSVPPAAQPASMSSASPSASARPAARPSAPAREPFADVPTDAAAPGLLQRMAREPANDGDKATPAPARPTSEPVLLVDRNDRKQQAGRDEDEFEGEGEEFDQGEVTVVANVAQLDILRETLGRFDAERGGKQPLTSTMPAPPGPNADSDELELAEALRAAGEAAVSMANETNEANLEPAQPSRASQPEASATASGPTASSASAEPAQSSGSVAASTPTSMGGSPATKSLAPSAQTLRLDAVDAARKSKSPKHSASKTRAFILVALVLMAVAAVGLMLWSQQANRAPAGKPTPKPAAPSSVKR